MPKAFTRVLQKRYENPHFDVTSGQSIDRTIYESTVFDRARFADCRWDDCRFFHVHVNPHSKFERCIFSRCRFERRTTNLAAHFLECRFEDCTFASLRFAQARFTRCHFSARFTSVVFFGPEAPEGWETIVEECDFTASQFIDSDFRLGIDTSTCVFPKDYDPHWVYPIQKNVA